MQRGSLSMRTCTGLSVFSVLCFNTLMATSICFLPQRAPASARALLSPSSPPGRPLFSPDARAGHWGHHLAFASEPRHTLLQLPGVSASESWLPSSSLRTTPPWTKHLSITPSPGAAWSWCAVNSRVQGGPLCLCPGMREASVATAAQPTSPCPQPMSPTLSGAVPEPSQVLP